MVKSPVSIFNRVEEERETLKQRKDTTIKSIYKRWQKEKLNETQKGIFIINVISKAYQRVKKIQNQMLQEKMSNMPAA